MTIHRIKLDSRAEEVHRLLDWLEPVLLESGVEGSEAFGLRSAIVELVNNAILHAYDAQPGFPVEVCIRLTHDLITTEVRDRGPRFDGPAKGAPADLLAESGRGFDIIGASADLMTHRRLDGWNICRIETRIGL
jgi:serine/threonine-protein kinase RsbW